MEHVVFFPGPDGGPAFRRVGSLDEAVAWVERLRNVDDLTDFSVHALTEVPLSVRAYYKVQVPGLGELAELPDLSDPVVEDADEVEVADTFAALPADAVPAQAGPDLDEEPVSAETAPRPGLGFFTS
ncbi:MAG: hypothetical protein M3O55_00545 [Actinomycetota bacterium]|nr:hypothetical protein [Actinomycetota bacterium]